MQQTDFELAMVASGVMLDGNDHADIHESQSISSVLEQLSHRERWAAAIIFLGVSLMAAVTFIAGIEAYGSDMPRAWSHALLALSIGQIAIVAGASYALYRQIEKNRFLIKYVAQVTHESAVSQPRLVGSTSVEMEKRVRASEDILPIGKLGDREYVSLPDGSIELETLLGRRRFLSLDAAKEFVGA
jgi:hypothetical protein